MKDKRPQSQFERQKSELEQLIELHKMRYIDLYYCDESHFGLTPNVGYAWQHKDNPVLLPAAKGKRLSVLGLMTPDCKLFSRTFEGAINSDGAIAAMDEFCQTITKRTVVVIDNAPIHRSKKFMAKIKKWKEQDLWVYYLPPYSPELNRIEILWRFIKYRWLPFDAFLNFQKLKERLNDTLNKIGTKCIINFY
ncbi:MAG: IS630 family transposase [Phocaeicola sp.]